jgi:hypothetical protein
MPLCCASCWLWLSTGQPNATLILGEAPADFGPAGPRADLWWRSESKSGGEREQRGESCPRNAAETSSVDATLVCRIVGFRRWVVTNDMRRLTARARVWSSARSGQGNPG